MTCRVSVQSRSAREGVWVHGGGIEIPCVYEKCVKKGLRSLRKELRDKLIQLVPTTDNTNLGTHPCRSENIKLDRRILSPLFIGVDIDLRYFITVLLSVYIIVTFFLQNTI